MGPGSPRPGAVVRRLASSLVLATALGAALVHGQIPGRNVNMVSGTTWPDGDPFLQRQNEPSVAASTRNPLHLLAGSNDYRTVDLPGLPDGEETGDAWLGIFKSFDGGQRWVSTLLPGYPQDPNRSQSVLRHYGAAADPVVRAGTNGLIYYAGLAFNRGENGASSVFVSRFIDNNNREGADPFAYLGTKIAASDSGTTGRFLDKPWMAVDIPRGKAPTCHIVTPAADPTKPAIEQNVPAGPVYLAYSSFTGDGATLRSDIMFTYSVDCGVRWSPPRRLSAADGSLNQGATIAIEPNTGIVSVAWRRFTRAGSPDTDAILVTQSASLGGGFLNAVAARRLPRGNSLSRIIERILEHRRLRGAVRVEELSEFDQGTSATNLSFRTNAYPAMTWDDRGRLYLAWTERGFSTAPERTSAFDGDAKIVMSSSLLGLIWGSPRVVSERNAPGHQFMPSLTFAGGKLMLVYYDLRADVTGFSSKFIEDKTALQDTDKRHTMDIRASMGTPGSAPVFGPSVRVSDYFVRRRPVELPDSPQDVPCGPDLTARCEPIQFNKPNLPMFKLGTVPFIGDYIDITPAPAFVPSGRGKWAYNTSRDSVPIFHAVWSDNRDVRLPPLGDWTKYTPPDYDKRVMQKSIYDPTQDVTACNLGNSEFTASRNQNVYTARIAGGLLVGSPGNAKPLSATLQRGFVVFAQNMTSTTRSFRMRILNQPAGGRASFSQFPLPPFSSGSAAPLTFLDVVTPPRSTASRTMFVTSSDPHAQINVEVVEMGATAPLPDGLRGTVIINADIENPLIEAADIENADIENADIENKEHTNADIENPAVRTADIENADIENADIENADIENADIENADIENADIENADIENADIENSSLTDVTWKLTNTGNTTAAFNVDLFLSQAAPAAVKLQLVLHKSYTTPAAVTCELKLRSHTVLVANVLHPVFVTPQSGGIPDPNSPAATNATMQLAPGEVGKITLRILDNDLTNNVTIVNDKGDRVSIDPAFVPGTTVSPVVRAQEIGTVALAEGVTKPPVITTDDDNSTIFFVQQPTTTVVNEAMAPVRVQVRDRSGAVLPGAQVTLSAAPAGGAIIGATTALTDASGIATFAGLRFAVPGTYRLQASVSGPGGLVIPPAQSALFMILPLERAGVSLSLMKTDSADPVRPGAPFTYTLTVTNAGTTMASGVVLVDVIPEQLEILGTAWTGRECTQVAREVRCYADTLEPGAIATLTLAVSASGSALITNTASVTSSGVELTPADNVATEQTMVLTAVACSTATFSGPVVLAAPDLSLNALAGDLNGDGALDLVVTLPLASSIGVYLGNGLGGFNGPAIFPAGTAAPSGVLSDFNNDGHLDLVLKGLLDVYVLLGNGTGGFESPVRLNIGASTEISDVRAGDFNGDGNPDVIVGQVMLDNPSPPPSAMRVMLGDGAGGFVLGTAVTFPADLQAISLAVGDFNNDNRADVAVSFAASGNGPFLDVVSILLGDGAGGFAAPTTVSLLQTVRDAAVSSVGDLNGDGHADLGVVEFNGATRQVQLLYGDGAGGFAPQILANASQSVSNIVSGDVNGDGRRDLIMSDAQRIAVQLGQPAGFADPTFLAIPGPSEPQVADFNGDGRLDVASAIARNGSGGVAVFLNVCGEPPADLSLAVSDSPDPVSEGDSIVYTLTVTNHGPTQATNVILTDTFSANGSVASATASSGTCTIANGVVTCAVDAIASGGSVGIQISVATTAAGTISSAAGVTSQQADVNPADNTVTETTAVNAVSRVITVTNTNDGGVGSLRQAIIESNRDGGDVDRIVFSIGDGGPRTIVPLTALPTVTQPAIIDATTQPGFDGFPIVELNGNSLAANGLSVSGGNTTVRGLVINRFTGNAINVFSGGGNVFEGNFIGTDTTGTIARPNTGHGVSMTSANNRVGGAAASARNLISGNQGSGVIITGGSGNLVQGNFVGTDTSGTLAVPNLGIQSGIFINTSSGNTIGGQAAGEGNLVSGNQTHAVTVVGATSGYNVIQGNLIGTTLTGMNKLANGGIGIDIVSAVKTIIGGPGPARNVISGNGTGIQIRTGAAGNVVAGNYIGTDVLGTGAIGNGLGISIRDGARANGIGGIPMNRNIISGNTGDAVSVQDAGTSGNFIAGNYIGTDVSGNADLGNGSHGVLIFNAGANTVGGTAAGAGNVISANLFGMSVHGTSGTIIQGNIFGLNAAGTADLGNDTHGVHVSTNATGTIVGGAEPGAGNVVSGNLHGFILADGSSGTQVLGNYIGTDASGSGLFPNDGPGITIVNSSDNIIGGTEPGARNVIAANRGPGVEVIAPALGNTIVGNRLFSNGGLGIDLGSDGITTNDAGDGDTGANNLQNFPVLTLSPSGSGVLDVTLNSTPRTPFVVHFYTTEGSCDPGGPGQGAAFIGSTNVTTDDSGNASFTFTGPAGASVTATATNDATGDTSEFSPCVRVEGAVRTWIHDGDGFWEDPANWSDGIVPGNGDRVSIDRPSGFYTVTVQSANVTLASLNSAEHIVVVGAGLTFDGPANFGGGLTMSGGALAGPGDLTFGGTSLWTGGQIIEGGAMTVTPGAQFSVITPDASGILRRTITNDGLLIWNQATLTYTNGSHIVNRAGGTFEIQSNLFISNASGVPLTLPNAGRLVKTGPGGPVTLDGVEFVTTGIVELRLSPDTDRVVSNAPGTLGGIFEVMLRGEFEPAPGTQFDVFSFSARTGTFATIDGNGRNYTAKYTSSGLSLVAEGGNGAPRANAGDDQSVNAGATVQLDGNGSTDPDVDDLMYAWSFVTRPAGSNAALSNPASATPTFVADVPGAFVVQLIVYDGTTYSATDTVEIRVNGPPLANAGPDQIVPVGGLVQLEGGGSSDPENATLSYHWILNTRPAGSAAALSNADLVNPTFIADVPGAYVLQLVVNDGLVNSASDVVTITTQNRAPVANAGADQSNIELNATVVLNGDQSFDPDNQPISFAWTFTSRPSGSAAVLINSNTASPSFTADRSGRYRVTLTVSDAQASGFDTVDVTTVNVPPVANAGADQRVPEGSLVTLNGSGSSDPDDNPLTHTWSFVSMPTGSTAQLARADTTSPTFTADLPGIYTVRLVVNDTIVDSPSDTVAITVFSNVITMALVETPLVGAGRPATLRVILPFEAPVGGVTVRVTSNADGVVTVTPPGTITILEMQTTGDIVINGIEPGTATLTATAPGYLDGEFEVAVTQNVLTVPTNLNVALGQTASLPITIPGPAPAGGLLVTLVSSNSSAVEVTTATVTIPAGAFGANGTVRGASPGGAVVTASSPGFSSASAQVVSQANLNITVESLQIRPDFPSSINIRLESAGSPVAAPAPGVGITFTPTDPGCVSIAPATIPTGLSTTSSQVTYGGSSALPCTTNVTASTPGVAADTVSVTVNPNPGMTLLTLPATVGAGLMDGTHLARLGESNHGGITVRITSSNPNVLRVSADVSTAGAAFVDIPLANGTTDVYYVIHGIEDARGAVVVTASAPAFTEAQGTANVVQPGLQLAGVPASPTTQSANTPFYAYLGPADATGEYLTQVQAVRAGGSGLTVTITHTNPAVAQLTTSAGAGQTRTVVVQPGQAYTPTSVATGGIEFDPLGGGTTTVSASVPGFISLGTQTVTVSAPGITLFYLPATVGAGLMEGNVLARLGGANHGGVTMRVTSSNPSVLRVSADVSTAGAAFVDIPVANGATDVYYVLHGIEDARGVVVVTASVPGFTDGQGTGTVVQPGLQLAGVPPSTTTQSANTAFYAYVGPADATGEYLTQVQPVRPGGAGLTVTFTHTNPTVAQLTTLAGSGQTRTVVVPAGQSYTPTSVDTGGIDFDPLGGGTTTVSASVPGFLSFGTQMVTVSAPGITLFSLPATLGAGLMEGTHVARLGGSNHGGVTVRITSSNPSVVRVSADASTAGSAFVDIPVANRATDVHYAIHGMEDARGAVVVTASAPGFTDGQGTVNVVQPGLQLAGVPPSATTLSANTTFYAYVGPADATGVYLTQVQAVRAGGAGLTVTMTHTNPAVAQLTTSAGSGQTRTVVVPPGQSFTPTSVDTGGIEFDPLGGGTTTVSASASGFLSLGTQAVTVSAPGITLFSLPETVGAGLMGAIHRARLEGSNHGGVTVRITSSNPSVLRVSAEVSTAGAAFVDIPVANGAIDALYVLHGMEDARGAVVVTASAPGFTDAQGTANVVQPGLQLAGVPASTTTLSANTPFYAYVGTADATGQYVTQVQSVRPGGAGLTVTFTHTNPAVAQLTTSAGSGQTRTVVVPPGQSFTPTSVATGGIEFDPVGGGTTTVSASAPGFLSLGAQSVTVSGPGITLFSLPATVGAGLMEGNYLTRLGGSNHGGVTVRITSSNPNVLRVSADLTTAGSAFVDIPVANGATDAYYVIHGIEGARGAVVVTASAPGFTDAQGTVNVVQPGLQIGSLPASIGSTDASVGFYVTVGLPSATGGYLTQHQIPRAGTSLTVTITNSASGVAQLVTLAGGAQSRTVIVPSGQYYTPTSVASGGIEFDPLSAGTTTVSATIPDFTSTTGGTVTVEVTGEEEEALLVPFFFDGPGSAGGGS
jgi:uncharacterized repeat protein (TIGR01451 family)